MGIVDAALGAASGGVLGLIGSAVGIGARYIQEKQAHRRRLDEQAHELRLLELQRQARAEETEQEIALVGAAGTWDGLRASIEADAAVAAGPGLPGWVRAVRALWRPVLTALLLAAVIVIWRDLGAVLPLTEAAVTGEYLARSVVATASTAVTWWFGDRALSRPQDKAR